jgi:poly(3-hydroxybutyrate) depolymerase
VRFLALLALLAAAPLAASPTPELPRGQVIPKIVCAAHPDRSYALYLPSSYSPERPWPIVYVFDSRGINTGRAMIELFTAGAERFGLLVASSHDSSGIVPMEENFRSLSAMWTDTHARLALDDRRAYGFGFSGMVRFVLTAAIQAPGTLAGIVSASGGYPLGHPPSKEKTPFPFFAMVGEKDFNFYELLDTETKLAAEGIPHRVELFDGSHEWPTDQLVTQALGWMELQAMKRGTRPKDPTLVETLWNEDLARARALEEAGRLWRAWRVWRAVAADFEGLRDTAEAKKKVAAFEASEPFRKMLKEREARDRRDREYLERIPRLFNAVPAEIRPDSLSQFLADLQIPDLRKRAKSEDPEERLSAERVLYAVYIQTGLYLPRTAMERKQWDRAIFFLQVASEVNPDSSRIHYRLATAWAGKGNRKKALESLKRAAEAGGTDLEEIETDPALASLRGDEEYKELVARLKQSPPPS